MIKYLKWSRYFRRLLMAVIALTVACSLMVYHHLDQVLNPTVKIDKWFTQEQLLISYNLFDMGVVDLNNDNLIDIFTLNHNALQSILINQGNRKFSDSDYLSQLRLDQSLDFPGLEPSVKPQFPDSGLYIYYYKNTLIIRANGINNGRLMPARIEIESYYPGKFTVEANEQINFNIQDNLLSSGVIQTLIDLEFQEDGLAKIVSEFPLGIGLPMSLKLNSFPLNKVYVGTKGVHPKAQKFVLALRDRHGMAWADYNGDEWLDVFIVRGGMRGKMNDVEAVFMDVSPSSIYNDELLINDGSSFKNITAKSGIIKDGCPARQVASVDFDGDGNLDIYVVCGKEVPANLLYPNQLYQQEANGSFVNVAAERGLDIPENGHFLWLDADNDGDMDLFWQDKNEFRLYINQSGQFDSQLIGLNPSNAIGKLAISDYDADGDLDLFAASPRGNTLLVNTGGKYQLTNPKTVGLPANSATANWVDYDNDGLIDLHTVPGGNGLKDFHTVPGGLYRQNRDHKFEATHLLEIKSPKLIREARSTWFDADNDGSLDLLIATRYYQPRWAKIFNSKINSQDEKDWMLMFYQNISTLSTGNHWLEIKLVGVTGNRQAIGARVEVITSDGVQFQQVGQAEGSHYSQGHYRLYFGLGTNQNVQAVKIFWPDGQLQKLENPAIDQLLVVKQSPN